MLQDPPVPPDIPFTREELERLEERHNTIQLRAIGQEAFIEHFITRWRECITDEPEASSSETVAHEVRVRLNAELLNEAKGIQRRNMGFALNASLFVTNVHWDSVMMFYTMSCYRSFIQLGDVPPQLVAPPAPKPQSLRPAPNAAAVAGLTADDCREATGSRPRATTRRKPSTAKVSKVAAKAHPRRSDRLAKRK